MKNSSYLARSPAFHSPTLLCGYPESTPMLLALSGGADSRLLLHLAAGECQKSGASLHLAHVHHGIRAKEADDDECFCRKLADDYGLPIHILHADVPTISRESGESLETAARRVRYEFFAGLMRQYSLPVLLTAHHADDNMETVLFHLARGTGLTGLCGIAPVRPLPEAQSKTADALPPVVVRPLLEWTKPDILAACRAYGLSYVTDSTNSDTVYTRNHLRTKVTPALAALVDHPQRQILRTCKALREDDMLLTGMAEDFLARHLTQDSLPRAELATAPVPIAKRALRLWLHRLTGQLPEACQVDAVLQLCQNGGTSRRRSIGNHYTVVAEKHLLRLYTEQELPINDAALRFDIPLEEGQHDYPLAGFRAVMSAYQKAPNGKHAINVYNPFIRDTLTFDTIIWCEAKHGKCPLFFRNRRSGDTLLLRGKHHSLRKLQNERGIPPALRDRIPLLCDNGGILWAPMIGVRDGILQPPTTAEHPPHAYMQLTVELLPFHQNRKACHYDQSNP